MSVAQAARIPRGMSLTPPSSPVRSMLLSTSQSLKHQPAPTTISSSSGSATSVNLPQTHFDSVEAYHERQEHIMDKAYMTEEMASPRSDTASEASEQMMPRRRVELEDFELIRVVGKGCAGRVLMVRHTHTHQIHAMKAISKRSVLANEELDHTLAELSILKRMGERSEGPSAFVSRLDYAFTDRDNFYFVMEFYSGGDLATQMETLKRLGERRTRFYAADLVQGLEELHREGIIARDLKPENILINAQGHAVLADFGLAKEFSYRGDPEPLHVSRYYGEPALPWWAGKGAGSRRRAVSGRERVVYDRAQSFVGTSEYLAPEVVQRLDYSYAVDWWALGCIIFECLVGQAPFKLNEEEDLMDLWEQIIESPWTEFFDQPRHIDTPWKSWKIREATFELLDGLLQKDPMRRLTEPCIKQMAFFANVDWETVKRGEYRNPRPLKIDRDPTLNMRYFPKLCLDEDVSVDMTGFYQSTPEEETASVGEEVGDASGEAEATEDEVERKDKPKNRTALNDYPTYIAEQARFRDELESFYYVSPAAGQDEQDLDEDDDYDMNDVSSDEEESSFGGDHLQYYYGSSPRQPEYRHMDEEVLMVEDSVDHPEHNTGADREHQPAPSMDLAPRRSSSPRIQEHQTDLPTIIPRPPTPSIGDPPLDHARSDPELDRISKDNAMSPSSSVGEEVITTPSLAPVALDSIVSPLSMATPLMPQVAGPPTTPVDAFSVATSLPKVRAEIPPDSPTPVRKPVDLSTMPSSPVAISPKIKVLVEQDEAIIRTSLSPRLGVGARLPSGLPASGLSTSDVVSVPSLGSAQNRIVRRNPHLTVDDHPPARLSVEVHGTVTRLDEDDWEAVDFGSDIPSMPNGSNSTTSPGTFLSRLRRKPSVIITSTMRRGQRTVSSSQRGHRSSDSGSSRVPSPTKGLVTPVKQLFGRRNIKLSRFRAFPGAKNRKSETSDTSALNSTSMLDLVSPSPPPSPTKNKGELEALGFGKSAERPVVGRRHTESGWFDKLRKSSKKATVQPSSVATSARAESDLGRSANKADALGSGTGRSLSDGEKPAAQPIRRNTEPGLSAEPSARAVTRDGGEGEANEDLRRKSEEVAQPKSRFLPPEDSLPPLVWEYGDIEIGGDASKLL